MVDSLTKHRLKENAEDSRDDPELGEHESLLLKNANQDPGSERDKNLFAGSEQKFQDVIQPVFLFPHELWSLQMSVRHAHEIQENRCDRCRNPADNKQDRIIGVKVFHRNPNDDIPDDTGGNSNTVELTQAPAFLFAVSQFHPERGADGHHQVSASAPEGHQDQHSIPAVAGEGQTEHAETDQQGGCCTDPGFGQKKQAAGEENSKETRQFAGEFQETTRSGGNIERVTQIVIEGSIKHAAGNPEQCYPDEE